MNLTTPDLSLYTVLLHLFLSLALCYACFCRLTKTDKDTPVRVRLTLFITADVALVCAGAPFFWGLTPSIWMNAVLAASLASKIVSSELWKHGVPKGYETLPGGAPKGLVLPFDPDKKASSTRSKEIDVRSSLDNPQPLANPLNDKISS